MAYRFNGTSDFVQFAISPLDGYTFGSFTSAILFKRAALAASHGLVCVETAAFGAKVRSVAGASNQLRLSYGGGTDDGTSGLLGSTAVWYLAVITGNVTTPRYHIWNGSSWNHSGGSPGSYTSQVIGPTELIRVGVSANVQWLSGDIVCCGIKKSDSTDLAVETLSVTAFSAWRTFGFDWLIGFDTSLTTAGVLQDQASPGTGDQTGISGTSVVSDAPGWSWGTSGSSSGGGWRRHSKVRG